MKRIVAMAFPIAGIVVLGIVSSGCYMPPTPTPHPGETVGPGVEATSRAQRLGLPTPGITVPSQPSPQSSQPAFPPPTAFGTPAEAVPPNTPVVGLTTMPPATETPGSP